MLSQFFRIRTLTVLLFMLVVAVSVDAFAATDEFLNLGPGNGSSIMRSYQVNNVAYVTRNVNGLNTLEQVSFDLAPLDGRGQMGRAYVEVVSGSNVWYPCFTGRAHDWDCPIAATPAAEANALNVVATE